MTRLLPRTNQFKRDVKRQAKRGKNLLVLKSALVILMEQGNLPDNNRDHPSLGGYRGARECHLESDWLLIYELTEDELILIRTGTHADLFD